MQGYWWPGYEMHLLGELQRQQNGAQFCDTLLQTEGISVPTHSCVLAALSPYLSQKLSASPSPPSGQQHRLQLQAVKAQTLLKLVGLLYSGKLEVKGSEEQNEVLAAARHFGIAELVEGPVEMGRSLGSCSENGFHAEGSRGRGDGRNMRDAQVQAAITARRDTDPVVERRSCVSIGTQTVGTGETSINLSGQVTLPNPEPPAPFVAQSLDFSIMLQPPSIALDKQFWLTSCPLDPSVPIGAPSVGKTPLNPSSVSATSTTALSRDSNSPRSQEGGAHQQPTQFADSTEVSVGERTKLQYVKRDGRAPGGRGDTEQPSSQANRGETSGGERGMSTGKRRARADKGMKSLAKMKQLQKRMETTRISVKVKLKRRTKGEVWEVVSVQDGDETSSVLTPPKQDGSSHKGSETNVSHIRSPHSTVQPIPFERPGRHILKPATTSSLKFPPHCNTSSDSQPPSADRFTTNRNDGPEAGPLLQHRDSVEESDEQIEKLLEDIMMGLDILPNLERENKSSQCLLPSHDRAPTTSQVPATQKDAAVDAAGSVRLSCNSTTDAGTRRCFTAQNQPSCSALSSALPDAAASRMPSSTQERSPRRLSAARFLWQSDRTSHHSKQPSKGRECPEAPTARSVIPSAFFSAGQKLPYSVFQEPLSQDNQYFLEFLPPMNGNETRPLHTLSLPCIDYLRLPRCLSPLKPCTVAAKHQPPHDSTTNFVDKTQQHGRPWLTENPSSLQFPLSGITQRKNKNTTLTPGIYRNYWSKKWQQHLKLKPQSGGPWAESCTAKEAGGSDTVAADRQNTAERKSDPKTPKEGEMTGDAVAPKRRKIKCTSHVQDAANSLSAHKDVKASDGSGSLINLSPCLVSLSNNNVLAKEREVATRSSNISSKIVRKLNRPSFVADNQRDKTTGSMGNTDQTRIRTRGFLKKTQEAKNDAGPECSLVAKPMAHRAKRATKQGVTTQKCGRPPKRNLKELNPPNNNPAIVGKKSHNKGSQQLMDNNLPKKDLEKGDRTKRRCKKRRMTRGTEVAVIPQKKTKRVEKTGKPDAEGTDIIPSLRKLRTRKQPLRVNVKGVEKVKRHSKWKRSKESQQTNETVGDAESERKPSGNGTFKNSEETELGEAIAPPEERSGSEESQVIFSITVEKNPNHSFNSSTGANSKSLREDMDISTGEKTSVFGDEDHPVSLSVVEEEEVAQMAAEREQPLKNPDEGTTCDTGVSNATQQTSVHDGRLSLRDTCLPQEKKLASEHNLHPQTPERSGPPPSEAGGISRTPGCVGEEEKEEVEVDVLLCSPVEVRPSSECEDGLNNTEGVPSDEEDEDMNEIDVTGD